jgi:membrane protease subunit (stomatin/prohibitin family)
LRARASEDFESIGLLLKAAYVTSISVPEEVEKALDERAQMGAIGNMQAYMQFKAARALGDAALAGGGEGGSFAGMGVGLGAGMGLGTAMASAIGQAMQPAGGGGAPTAAPAGGGLAEGFGGLKQLVGQQLTLSAEEKAAATQALDGLMAQLASPTATIEDVKAARGAMASQFPWLEEPLQTLLNTPVALQLLGQIAARSM